jgi:hypothetical protein
VAGLNLVEARGNGIEFRPSLFAFSADSKIADSLNPHGGGIGARFRRYSIFRVAHRNEEVMRESLPLAGPRSALAGLLVLA